MIEGLNPALIRKLLEEELPGERAQLKMAPRVQRNFPGTNDCRKAGVMILLYPDDSEVHVVFMKRNEYNGPHSGQISFPGGMQEEGEHDLSTTALREAEEETGIPADRIQLLGKLSPLFIPVSNFCVAPYIGWIDRKPEFKPDHTEVQYLITPALSDLLDRTNHHLEWYRRGNEAFETPCIRIGKDTIWGATAMILSEFMELIERLQ